MSHYVIIALPNLVARLSVYSHPFAYELTRSNPIYIAFLFYFVSILCPCPCYVYFNKKIVFDPIEGLLLELGGSSLSLQSERLGRKARCTKLDKYHTISSCFVHVPMVSPAAAGNGCCRLRICTVFRSKTTFGFYFCIPSQHFGSPI